MNIVKLIGIVTIIISSNLINAQPKAYIDSLESLLSTKKIVLDKIYILSELAYAHMYPNPQKGLRYINKAIQLLPNDSLSKRGDLLNTKGCLLGQLNKIEDALRHLDSAIIIFKKIKDQEGIAFTLGNKSSVYCLINEYKKASQVLYQSIEINKKNGYKEGQAANFMTLVSINSSQGDYENGLYNSKKAFSLYKEISKIGNMAFSCFNTGILYSKIEKLDSALVYFTKALELHRKSQNKEGCAMSYEAISSVYDKMNNIELAYYNINKAIELDKYIISPKEKINLKLSLATSLYKKELYSKSIFIFKSTSKDIKKHGFKSMEKRALEGLIKNYSALNHFKKSFQYQEQLLILKDSIFNETTQKQIKELEIKYNTKKKEEANILLTKERDIEKLKYHRSQQLIIGISIVLILVLLISYLLIQRNKTENSNQTIQLKNRLLRNQMNPHFIFNSLVAIQSFVYKNEPKEADKFISSFAKLVRAILENSRNEYISINKEIQWLKNYLKLQLLRFENKFAYTIDIDSAIDLDSTLIPPMLTQPFIENALEHGLQKLDYQGLLSVKFQLAENKLIVHIEDNGLGLNSTIHKTGKEKHISLATAITKERIDYLNKNNHNKIYFEICNKNEFGTLVTFSIPFKQIF